MNINDLTRRVRAELHDTTPLQRAELLNKLSRAVYDHVKFNAPEGGGFEGAGGPEREALARIVDATQTHLDNLEWGDGLHLPSREN